MTRALEIVKQAYKAWEAKARQALRNLLHTNYKAKAPVAWKSSASKVLSNAWSSAP